MNTISATPRAGVLNAISTPTSLKSRLSSLIEQWISFTPISIAISEKGHGHDLNQDAALAPTKYRVALADGVSNSYMGELAAFLAVSAFDVSTAMTRQNLRKTVFKADETVRKVYEMLGCNENEIGYCTLLAAELEGSSKVNLIHLGDSRAYLITSGFLGKRRVTQLTEDQTYEALSKERPDQNYPKEYAEVMYQAIGLGISMPEKILTTHNLPPGSIILLCTDGVFKGMREPLAEIAGLAARHPQLERFVRAVVERGQQGSTDDVSAAAIRTPAVLGARTSFWLLFAVFTSVVISLRLLT